MFRELLRFYRILAWPLMLAIFASGSVSAQQTQADRRRFSCAIHEVGKAPAAVLSLEIVQPIVSLSDRLTMNVTAWTIDNRQSATLRLSSIADDRIPDVFRIPVHGGLWLGSDAQLLLTRVEVLKGQILNLIVLSDRRAIGYSCERSRP